MRTEEFIKRVEELGFGTWITGNAVYISKGNDKTIARVEVHKTLSIDFVYPSNRSLEEEIRKKLFDLVVEYASTPVEDREEEKKFYLRHRLIQTDGCYMYLQKTSDDDKKMSVRVLGFSDNDDIKFSGKEIEEIKEKFDTDLKDFELLEVDDD